MPGRTLKNHGVYLQKLKLYAKACEVKIVYREDPELGGYCPTRRMVFLDPDLDESTEVAILLHELGHQLDDALHLPGQVHATSRAYLASYRSKPTRKQKALVLACERRAWRNGRAIAKRLRIPLGKWFESERERALSGYRNLETQNR